MQITGFTEDNYLQLHVNTDMSLIVKALASTDSGLDVRDRMWLKITIPNAFIGSDLVDWLFTRVQGFTDRREARKYASNLLKVNSSVFCLFSVRCKCRLKTSDSLTLPNSGSAEAISYPQIFYDLYYHLLLGWLYSSYSE